MGSSINGPGFHIDFCDTDFNCPACGYKHVEEDWYPKLDKSKEGLIYIKCRGCKEKLGVTVDIKGDVKCWLKKEENNM